MSRFSRQKLVEHLYNKIWFYEKEFGFVYADGWDQVTDSDTKTKIAYGNWEELYQLIDDISNDVIGKGG